MRPVFYVEVGQDRWKPPVDVYETADALILVLELAGADPDTIDVQVDQHAARLRGTRRRRPAAKVRRIHRLEIADGPFELVLPLPVPVDQDAAEARYEEGFLYVTLPLARPARPRVERRDDHLAEPTA